LSSTYLVRAANAERESIEHMKRQGYRPAWRSSRSPRDEPAVMEIAWE